MSSSALRAHVDCGPDVVGYHRRVSERCLYRRRRTASPGAAGARRNCCKESRCAAKPRPDKASYKLVSRPCSGTATRQRCRTLACLRSFQHMTGGLPGAHTRVDRCIIQSPALRWVISGVRVMARRPPNDGASWSARELTTLRALAKAGTPTGQVARKLGRTAAAVQQKAMRAGISFRAAKRSGARRKK